MSANNKKAVLSALSRKYLREAAKACCLLTPLPIIIIYKDRLNNSQDIKSTIKLKLSNKKLALIILVNSSR